MTYFSIEFGSYSYTFAEMTGVTIKCLSEAERPREKLLMRGVTSLSEAELIAILLRSGTNNKSAIQLGEEVLNSVGGIHNLLDITYEELIKIPGIGIAKALTIISAFELAKRSMLAKTKLQRYNSVDKLGKYLQHKIGYNSNEIFIALYFNNNMELIGEKELSTGGFDYVVLDIKTLFRNAIKLGASGIVISHNHPSGKLVPSSSDVKITKDVVKASNVLEIKLIDHIIVSKNGYYSFVENGLI